MIEFIIGASGTGKSTLLLERIQTASDSGRKVCVLVPEQFSYEFDKKLYKTVGAKKFNDLLSLSFSGLSRQLFQLYGDSSRGSEYADEFSRMILVHLAVNNVRRTPAAMQFYGKISDQSGFAENVLKLISEMKQSGISPHLLAMSADSFNGKLRAKTGDIVRIYLEYERLLTEYGYKDNFDDIKRAAEIAACKNYFTNTDVYIDEFESFTGDQLIFLENIIASADNVCISLRTDNVNAEKFTLFETVNRTYYALTEICKTYHKDYVNTKCDIYYRFSSRDIEYLSSNIMRSKKTAPFSDNSENITVFEARDIYSEAEYVCASIKHLICSDSTLRYRDIAIISNNINIYADVLKASFERYDIPCFLSIEKSVMHTSVMIFFSALLDILCTKKYSSELIFRYLKCRLLGFDLTEISLLENFCYKWSVDGDIWTESFNAEDENLSKLENMRSSIIAPLEKLRNSVKGKKPAKTLCRLVYDFIVEAEVEHQVAESMNELIKSDRDHEAAEFKRLWGCFIDILDGIADTLNDSELTINEFRKIVRSMLSQIEYSLPPQTLDSVTAASSRTSRLSSPRVVFIMGANDGDFPNTVRSHGLFSEADKQVMSECGIEISRPMTDIIASERLVVYKSVSAPSEKLYISYPLSDLSGQAKYPAAAVDEAVKMFGEGIRLTEDDIQLDYYAMTMNAAFYHYMQNRGTSTPGLEAVKRLLNEDGAYRRKIDYVLMRSGRSLDYKVTRQLVEALKSFEPFSISPTSLETYNTCHFKYFCKYCLSLFASEKIELDAVYAGNLIHSCYYNIISSRSKDAFTSMPFEEIQNEIKKAADAYKEKEMGGQFAKTPRFELGFTKLKERLVQVFLHTQQELMASSFIPTEFEYNLTKEHNKPLRLRFADDRTLTFGGVIDRVDICETENGKYVKIVDYKSGRKDITPQTLASGTNMQMLLYLFAITEKNTQFYDYIPAGVLYSPVTIKSIDADGQKIPTLNQNGINKSLKTTGLVLSDTDVLDALEHNIEGKFIPVKTDKNGAVSEKSSCITTAAFDRLREYSYSQLIEMAESVYEGRFDAEPLIFNDRVPCTYCDYSDMCGNSQLTHYRLASELDMSEAEEILNMKKEENENGLD